MKEIEIIFLFLIIEEMCSHFWGHRDSPYLICMFINNLPEFRDFAEHAVTVTSNCEAAVFLQIPTDRAKTV